jgi:membrane protease YdiL (CAAX protease family)
MDKAKRIELKLLPIVEMLSVTIFVALVMILINSSILSLTKHEIIGGVSSWLLADIMHIPQFVIPFVIIYFISNGKLRDYGFNLKEKTPIFTHKRMFLLGVLFGFFMSLRYIIQVVAGKPLDIQQPENIIDVIGNLSFQWIVVGISEETMFRGLIQTFLTKKLKGYIEILGHDLHVGAVIGAIIWGAFHFINILVMPIGPVIFFAIFTTIAGLAMGYAYQETGSLLTTIIVHNTIFGVPLTIGYLLYWLL